MWRHRYAGCVLVLGLTLGCSGDGSHTGRPASGSGSFTPSPSGTIVKSSSPAATAASRSPSPPTSVEEILVFQQNNAVYRLSLRRSAAKPTKLFATSGLVLADPRGRYLAVREADRDRIVIRALGTGKIVATASKADAVAFDDDERAIASVRPQPPSTEHDCHRPTHLVEVDLRTGGQRLLRQLDDQFLPFAILDGTLVGHTVADDCETPAATFLDLTSGRQRAVRAASEISSVSQDGEKIWVGLDRDRDHPHGSQLIVDPNGRELARLPYESDAVFGLGDRIAYTEVIYKDEPPPENLFSDGTKLRIGHGLPQRGDRNVDLPSAGMLVWSTTGNTVVLRSEMRDANGDFVAMACTVALSCRRLPLRWDGERIDVTLLAVVPATTLASPYGSG